MKIKSFLLIHEVLWEHCFLAKECEWVSLFLCNLILNLATIWTLGLDWGRL